MLKSIVVPLDGSELAEGALPAAAKIARASGALIRLLLVHVPGPFGGDYDGARRTAPSETAERAYLERIAEQFTQAGLRCEARVLRGPAASTICSYAKRNGVSLVVMTTHGRTGFSRLWIGSVADAVMRGSHSPVLLIRCCADRQGPIWPARVERILVALDGSPRAEAILDPVLDLAGLSSASVTLVRIVTPVPTLAVDPSLPYSALRPLVDDMATVEARNDAERYLEGVAGRIKAPVSFQTCIEGHPASGILEIARDIGADVVAMTTHGRGASRLVLGSVADKVLRVITVPLLLYRAPSPRKRPASATRRTRHRSHVTAAAGT